jgi:hypothetical protein
MEGKSKENKGLNMRKRVEKKGGNGYIDLWNY